VRGRPKPRVAGGKPKRRGPRNRPASPKLRTEGGAKASAPEAKAEAAAPVGKLPGAALRHLRALGHELAPVVMIGKEGITDALVAAAKAALLTHELIKVRVQAEAPVDRKEGADALAQASGAVLAQVLGRTFLLYRRHPKKPKITLPRG
jgi:RNA-binding protein